MHNNKPRNHFEKLVHNILSKLTIQFNNRYLLSKDNQNKFLPENGVPKNYTLISDRFLNLKNTKFVIFIKIVRAVFVKAYS